jgi:hypothetical protein
MQKVCRFPVASLLGVMLCFGGLLSGCVVDPELPPPVRREDGGTGPGTTADMFSVQYDLAPIPGGIGGPCTMDSQCLFGSGTKRCWKQNILEEPGNIGTPGGYCTAQCTKDEDCAGQGICATVGAGQKYCLKGCASPGVCRFPDYACFVLTNTSGYCWPAVRLNCNPTSNDGSCPGFANDPKLPNGCIRRAFEDLGECHQGCQIGPSSCPFTQGGKAQHCVYINATRDTNGLPTRDKFKGNACFQLYDDARVENATCNYFDECQDGLQCNLSPGGDRKCRPLCLFGVEGACTDPNQRCRDVFDAGLGNAGLCLPK